MIKSIIMRRSNIMGCGYTTVWKYRIAWTGASAHTQNGYQKQMKNEPASGMSHCQLSVKSPSNIQVLWTN
jgi:hypothetical protein